MQLTAQFKIFRRVSHGKESAGVGSRSDVRTTSIAGQRFDQRMLRGKLTLRFAELPGRRRRRRERHRQRNVGIVVDIEIVAERRLKVMLCLFWNKFPGKNLKFKFNYFK